MKFTLCILLTVSLAHHLLALSVIAMISEYNMNADPMLTFILSKVEKFGESKCGFGEVETKVPNGGKAPVVKRSPMLLTKSVLVGENPLLKKFFDFYHIVTKYYYGKQFNEKETMEQPMVNIEYINGENKKIVESKMPIIDINTFLEAQEYLSHSNDPEYMMTHSKKFPFSMEPEFSSTMSNNVFFSEKRDFNLCYENEIVQGYLQVIIFLEEEISDFKLSFKENMLTISKNVVEGQTLLEGLPIERNNKRTTSTSLLNKKLHLSISDISFLKRITPKYIIEPLISEQSRLKIAAEINAQDADKKLVITLNSNPIYLLPKPQEFIYVFIFVDGFSTGDCTKAKVDVITTSSTVNSCPIESITVREMKKDHYAILIVCAAGRRINV